MTACPPPRYDWDEVQKFYDQGYRAKDCIEHFGFASSAWFRAIRTGKLVVKKIRKDRAFICPGMKFGRLTVLGISRRTGVGTEWKCQCECGRVSNVKTATLNFGNSKSCGCQRHKKGNMSELWKGCGEMPGQYWGSIIAKCSQNGRIFSITQEYAWGLFLAQKRKCALSGVELNFSQRGVRGTASLDRIDSSKGYVVGNVQWVHKTVNILKGKLSDQMLIEWSGKIHTHRALP